MGMMLQLWHEQSLIINQEQWVADPGGPKLPDSLCQLCFGNLITYKFVCEFAPLTCNINWVLHYYVILWPYLVKGPCVKI